MLKGLYLTLLIGPAAPIIAPRSVMDALTSIQVQTETARTGFQLTFAVSKDSPLLKTMLPAGYFDPMITRVIIVATVKGFPHVLVDGIITQQELKPGGAPGESTLTVTGDDLSVLMDIVELPFMRYPGMPANVQVISALAKYAGFGIVPAAIPPVIPHLPNPLEKIPTHRGTDLEYIRSLANLHGYVFFVDPGPLPGSNVAYWGPDLRIPNPQAALNVNMDAHTNVESLSFSLDGLSKKIVVLHVFDPATKKIAFPVPVPTVSILRPPLGARPTLPSRVEFQDVSKLSLAEAAQQGLSILFNSSHSITASGSLDVMRYGKVLMARQLVGVRGAGLAYDGLYYVNSITHQIERGKYTQSFSLSRDGLISLTPKVVP